jgi:Spy/CpxP family protein refolding chaperone
VGGNNHFKLLVAVIVLSVLVGTSSLAPAKEEGKSDSQTLRAHLLTTLNLSGYNEKKFIGVEEKYDRVRQEALERMQKSEESLEKLLSGDKPDEVKLKELTTAITADQDVLVNTYKARRDEILALLTPAQQGKYLLATLKWQQKLLETYGKHKAGQQDEKKKPKAP